MLSRSQRTLHTTSPTQFQAHTSRPNGFWPLKTKPRCQSNLFVVRKFPFITLQMTKMGPKWLLAICNKPFLINQKAIACRTVPQSFYGPPTDHPVQGLWTILTIMDHFDYKNGYVDHMDHMNHIDQTYYPTIRQLKDAISTPTIKVQKI